MPHSEPIEILVTFWEHFWRLLVRRPLPAIEALYWHLTRRMVRARNRLLAATGDLSFAYELWIARTERNSALEPQFRAAMRHWSFRPQFSILLYGPADASAGELSRSLASIARQIYPPSSLVDEAIDSIAEGIATADGDYIVPLRIGDVLSETGLFRIAEAIQGHREASILYGDHDHLDAHQRRIRPWFKPEWNEEMFFAHDYLSPAVAIGVERAREAVEAIGTAADDLGALLLEATARADVIVHVPHIICHVAGASDEPKAGRVDAVAKHLASAGASCTTGAFGTVKVNWPLPADLPLVSIIIPTKDKVELLQACVESVLEQTTYPNFEVLIIDNGSTEQKALAYLAAIAEDPRVKVLPYARRYNFSAINNFAAEAARGQFLCLLNNDTEVIERDWLTDMMRYAVREDVGAVGAKLLYDDASIQHAGVVVGVGGAAGHAHRFLSADEPGYFRQAHVAQFVSAVTAACLVVAKARFVAVGGLDEEGLAVAFNDVDFCLKLQAAGWRNVYVPHAVLLHHESKSRGSDMSPRHIDRYRRELRVLQERWSTTTYKDPLHNPNLDRYSEKFVIRL